MRNVLLIVSLLMSFNSFANRQLFDSKWDNILTRSHFYSTDFYSTDDITKYPKLLIGETICFIGEGEYFYDNKEYGYQCFYNLNPDTIWIKKPKKNPKLNKDYTLMPYYHGIGKYDKGSWIENDKRYTQKKYIDNCIFRVDSVSNSYKEEYYERSCNVFLTNIQTNEKLFLKISSSYDFSKNKISIYSPSLSEKIFKKGSKVYKYFSSRYEYKSKDYVPRTVKEISYKCDFSYNEYSPYVEVILSSELGYEEKLTYKKGSHDFTAPVYILEEDYNKLVQSEIESEKVYELNSQVELNAVKYEYPFSFRVIWGESNSSDYVYQKISNNSPYTNVKDFLGKDNQIRIGGKQKINRKDYYIATCYGKCFYIPVSNVTLKDDEKAKLDSLINSPQEAQEMFIEMTKGFELYQYAQDTKDILKEFETFKKYGLSIVKWSVYDESDYTDGTGIRFTFYNPTKSMIKYITITFVGYNAVDDPVGRAMTKKCIGPIEPDESGEYQFEYAWFTDIVEYAKIRSIKVDYKNGTSKTITNIGAIEWSDELYDFFVNPPLKELKTLSVPGEGIINK